MCSAVVRSASKFICDLLMTQKSYIRYFGIVILIFVGSKK